jgi:hypothetical protein
MTINKKTALFFLLINAAYVFLAAFLFAYQHETLINRLTPHQSRISYNYWPYWQYSLTILNLITLAGIYWALRLFKQKQFISIGVMMYLCWRVVMVIVIALLSEFSSHEKMFIYFEWINYASILVIAYFFIVLFFVNEGNIKKYIIGYAIFIIIAVLVPAVTPMLYDDFGLTWVLINKNILFMAPYIVTLFMFSKIYNMAALAPAGGDEAA